MSSGRWSFRGLDCDCRQSSTHGSKRGGKSRRRHSPMNGNATGAEEGMASPGSGYRQVNEIPPCRAVLILSFFFLVEFERETIGAIAQARRLWPVREDMAEMRVAFRTADFSPAHEVGTIHMFLDGCVRDRCIKTWPACAGIIFGFRLKQRRPAADARIEPGLLLIPMGTRECRFCPMPPRDFILGLAQLGAPFCIGFVDLALGGFRWFFCHSSLRSRPLLSWA